MEPNKTYGYAGPICYCPKNPANIYQRPASKTPDNFQLYYDPSGDVTFNGIIYTPKSKLDLAVAALKYIANSTPGPEQTFEIENKLAAQKALKEIGE